MHTVDLLEQAIAAADALGYRIRSEWLGGSGGGLCHIRGQRWIFIDLALGPVDQFHQVAEALREDPAISNLRMSDQLRRALQIRKAA